MSSESEVEANSETKVRKWTCAWGPVLAMSFLQLLLLPFMNMKVNRFPVEYMSQIPIAYWMVTPYGCVVAFILFVILMLCCYCKKVTVWLPLKQQLRLYVIFLIFYVSCNPYLGSNWMQAPAAMLMSVAVLTLAVGLVGRLAIVVWSVIFFFAFFVIGLYLNNVNLSAGVMAQIMETSSRDAVRYMTPLNLSFLGGSIAASVILSYMLWRVVRHTPRVTLLAYGSISFLLPVAFMYGMRSDLPTGSRLLWPVINGQEIVNVTKDAVKQIRTIRNVISMLPDESQVGDCCISTVGKDSGVICILHIGESVNASHCSINGYARETTPWLASQTTLINFNDCISSADMTDWAVLTMLTNGRRSIVATQDPEMLPSSPGIMDIFHRSGFLCYGLWDLCYLDDSTNNLFAHMVEYFGRTAEKMYGYKGDITNQLSDVFSILDSAGNSNVFVMINNNGSHCYYDSYDKESPPFPVSATPSADFRPQTNAEHAEIYVNAYDSTIHYMDSYIRRIVEHMRGKPFIYVYMSDHGEYLGEGGHWTRASTPSSKYYEYHACRVPFFILASPEFEQLHPHFKTSLDQLRKAQNISTAHEHLFHTLHGIMGISSRYYDSALDLTREDVKPYTGPHPDRKP